MRTWSVALWSTGSKVLHLKEKNFELYLKQGEVLKTDEAGDSDDQRPHSEVAPSHSILSIQHL